MYREEGVYTREALESIIIIFVPQARTTRFLRHYVVHIKIERASEYSTEQTRLLSAPAQPHLVIGYPDPVLSEGCYWRRRRLYSQVLGLLLEKARK
jgi:hypothetical protein